MPYRQEGRPPWWPSVQSWPCKYLSLICDKSLSYRGLNLNSGYFGSFIFIFIHMENYVCLSHGVYMTCVMWRAVMRIMTGVEDLV
jgi:hypothetical protein